jgi:hypothetical protein
MGWVIYEDFDSVVGVDGLTGTIGGELLEELESDFIMEKGVYLFRGSCSHFDRTRSEEIRKCRSNQAFLILDPAMLAAMHLGKTD